MNGFPYLHGAELALTKAVIRECERILELRSFEEIQPPIVVRSALVVGEADRPVAPGLGGLVFYLQADGEAAGVGLALSYENTLPTCYFYLTHCADTPTWVARRFYYISPHFRNEREVTAAHRLRQFRQVGFEIIGGDSAETLPEAIQTGSALLTGLGLAHTIRVSDVTILPGVFRRLALDAAERSALRLLYDGGDADAFAAFLAGSSLGARQQALLARLFFSGGAAQTERSELLDLLREYDLQDALARIEQLDGILGALPSAVGSKAALDLRLVRSARMYTGPVFQYYLDGSEHECGGGGEYNGILPSLGGPDINACGAAFGLERLIYAARKHFPAQATAPGEVTRHVLIGADAARNQRHST